MPKKKNTLLTPDLVFDLAREGKGYALIGERVGLRYQGVYKAINADEELKAAYQDGHRLHDEELIEGIRKIATDPTEKANNRVQAFDKLMRHTETDRKGGLQTAVLANLSDAELQGLYESMQRRALEERLGKSSQAHDAEGTTEQVQVTDQVE